VKSDPIPTMLQGIQLDVRTINVKLDRRQFSLNPTSCEKMAVTGEALSLFNQSVALSDPFQVGSCEALGFNPKLRLFLKGQTKRVGNPALKAVLTTQPGEANIGRAQVTLPRAELLDNAHIHGPCTRTQFAEGKCPPSSVLGHARAETPLLDHPLEGPVYLMTGFGHRLPDVAADLNGQIRVLLHGKVDTGKGGGLRNTFEVVPDAPVSRFVLEMLGGKKGLLENSENLCAHPATAKAAFTAHDGKVSEARVPLKTRCRHSHKRRGRRRHH